MSWRLVPRHRGPPCRSHPRLRQRRRAFFAPPETCCSRRNIRSYQANNPATLAVWRIAKLSCRKFDPARQTRCYGHNIFLSRQRGPTIKLAADGKRSHIARVSSRPISRKWALLVPGGVAAGHHLQKFRSANHGQWANSCHCIRWRNYRPRPLPKGISAEAALVDGDRVQSGRLQTRSPSDFDKSAVWRIQ